MDRMTALEKGLKEFKEEFEKRVNEFAEKLEAYKTAEEKQEIPVIGGTVELVGIKWIILDKTENGYLALAEKSLKDRAFGSNNDWRESEIRRYLNDEVASLIEDALNIELPEFERDLLSLDGQTEYGTCRDKVSLITVDEYRKYRKYIPNAGYWWWTCTPDSTKYNGNTAWIRVVSSGGDVHDFSFYYDLGVRPFCIFPSSLFESEES